MPSFDLLFGGYWFKVNVEDYVLEVEAGGSKCYLCMGYSEDGWILGDTFMRGWYNIHDHTNNKIGFYPIGKSGKPVPTKALSSPTAKLPYVESIVTEEDYDDTILGLERTTFIIVAVCVSVVVAASITLLFIFCFFQLMTKVFKA